VHVTPPSESIPVATETPFPEDLRLDEHGDVELALPSGACIDPAHHWSQKNSQKNYKHTLIPAHAFLTEEALKLNNHSKQNVKHAKGMCDPAVVSLLLFYIKELKI
jgi:hypothetical protein